METLLIHLGSVALLALAVEVLCRAGKFRPAVCHALWLVVLVKLITPPLLSWPLSFESASMLPAAYETRLPNAAAEVLRNTAESAITRPPTQPDSAVANSGHTAKVTPLGWAIALTLGFWAAGSAAFGARVLLEARRARCRSGSGRPVPDWLESRLASTASALSVPMPRATVVDDISGVYLQIAGAPVLLISESALRHLGPDRWDAILTHELAHLKRRDHWVAWLLLAAGVVWWWNPCLWWTRGRIHLYSELACDAWVVNTHPGERRNYAETMVQVLDLFSRQQALAPAMGLAVWSGAHQKRRLEMIMKAEGASALRPAHALLLVLTALAVSPAWLAPAADEAIPVPDFVAIEDAAWVLPLAPTDRVLADLEKPISLQLDDVHVSEVLRYIRETFDVNIVLDQRVVAPPPEDGVETPEGPTGGAPYVTDGMIPVILVKDVALKISLRTICRPRGLTYQARANHIWVSSPEQLQKDREAPVPHAVPENDDKAIAHYEELVDLNYEHIHVKDLLEILQDKFELNVVIDKRAFTTQKDSEQSESVQSQFGVNAAPKGRTTPTHEGEKAKPAVTDGYIRDIHLDRVSVAEGLYVATRMLGLSYSIEAGFVFVSTETTISQDGFRKPVE